MYDSEMAFFSLPYNCVQTLAYSIARGGVPHHQDPPTHAFQFTPSLWHVVVMLGPVTGPRTLALLVAEMVTGPV
jgi:hypothetical protein